MGDTNNFFKTVDPYVEEDMAPLEVGIDWGKEVDDTFKAYYRGEFPPGSWLWDDVDFVSLLCCVC